MQGPVNMTVRSTQALPSLYKKYSDLFISPMFNNALNILAQWTDTTWAKIYRYLGPLYTLRPRMNQSTVMKTKTPPRTALA